ncbi:MAG: CBS domain-containing protein [Gammaproteobacteria bacterium]|nr:CBS domain-containing protein [Gammaproteobacteria bacterium]
MRTDYHVIPHTATIQEAAKMMRDHDVGLLPVTENDKMIGTVTDRDVVVRVIANGGDTSMIPVSQAMTARLIYTYEDRDVNEAIRLMEENQVRRLIIVNQAQQVVGLVSLSDITRTESADEMVAEVLRELADKPTQ